ncbi:MAG: TolC family protein, partial [Deltaproteobacteria bacterium]|nr:TolC family protein [Deltaproteobacteria bacterium]
MSVVTRLRAPCALLLASAACASIDPAKGHDEVSQLVQARTGAATSFAQGRPEDAQVQAQLDRLLAHGLTPQTAVQIALLSNPQLLATYEDLGVSQAELVQAGLLSNPKLAFGLGFPLGQSGGGVAFDLSLAQNFLDLFLMPLKKRAARTQFDADVLHVAQETLAVAAATQQACAELQAQERVVELEREALETHRLTRDFAARLHEAGNTTELAFATEQAAFEDTSLELGKEELTRVELREKLDLLLGLSGRRAEWTLAEPLPELPAADPSLDDLEQAALKQRLDLASLQKRAELQQQALSLAQDSRAFGLIELGLDLRQDTEGPRLLGPSLTLEL